MQKKKNRREKHLYNAYPKKKYINVYLYLYIHHTQI